MRKMRETCGVVWPALWVSLALNLSFLMCVIVGSSWKRVGPTGE